MQHTACEIMPFQRDYLIKKKKEKSTYLLKVYSSEYFHR